MMIKYEIYIDGNYRCVIFATTPKQAINNFLDNGGKLLLSQRIEAKGEK